MRSEKQNQASRQNGKKSKGPTSPEGKAVSKFNGLKHGLRAEHVVLPGEDPAAFEAERRAWFHDWTPKSHTRAVLVERAAVASWRLRRAVRAEAALLGERADAAARAFDAERFARVDRALARAEGDPGAAMSLLTLDATGLDRLIASCAELARALEAGPGGWDRPVYHARLMLLLGRRLDENPSHAGAEPRASARLLAANDAGYAANPGLGFCEVIHPLPESEFEAAAEALRGAVAREMERFGELRRTVPEPDDLRRRAVAAACADGSEEGKLRHRYEMAIDRSLRATIGQLVALEKSGADLPEDEPQTDEDSGDAPSTPDPSEVPPPGAPGSLGAREPGTVPTPGDAPIGGPRAPISVPEPSGGGGSRR
jgi:hypothetical protein